MDKIILKNTFYQLATRIFTSGIGFLTTLIIARQFGVLGYGDFTKIVSFVALFYLIADFGLNAVFLRDDEKGIHFKDLFYFRLLIAASLIILASAMSFLLPFNKQLGIGFSESVRLGIIIFSLSILNQAILTTCNAVFQRKLKYHLSMFSSIGGSAITLIFVLVFSILNFSLYYIILAMLIGGGITSLLSIILTKENISLKMPDTGFIKKLLIEGFPLALALIFNLIYFRIDIILLSFLKPTSDVGIYGFSYKFFDFLIALPLFLSNALYPSLLMHKNNYRKFFAVTKKYFLLLLMFSFFLTFVLWFLAPLIGFVRSDFYPSVFTFRILLLSLPFFFATSILQWVLIAKKEQKFLMFVYLFASILNIVLNLIFIPIASYTASAIITGVSEGIVFALLLAKTINVQKNFPKQ
ncbi:MAG: oligosaccharide flippase family protein [bacterium]|nr:oligosaccharide flippase family protein [bacterium]